VGSSALFSTIGTLNTAVGYQSGYQISSANYNTLLGYRAGYGYTNSDSSNISIGTNGTESSPNSNVLKIGAGTGAGNFQLNKAFISGINGITVSTADQLLVINSSDQIGSVAHGTSGQILKTNGAGANPSWINVPSSSISITGNSGGALTGAAFTFTGGTTGLTFSGAGSTETLGGTLVLANGGTSASLTASNGGIFYSTASAGAILSGTSTANQMLQSGASTTPAWSTSTWPATTTINQLLYSSAANTVGGVTAGNYGVLISSSAGVPSWLANGTTGQILTATTSGTPSWEAISSSGGVTTLHSQDGNNVTPTTGTINISGGNSLTTTGTSGPNTITISLAGRTQYNVQTGGSSNSLNNVAPGATSGVPLISQGSSSQPIFGTALVAGGGTGATTLTSHGVLLGNTTSAITATAAGTTGQVLTGVTGSAPTFQSPAASSISITGDSGGALTGAAFTIYTNNASTNCGSSVLFSGSGSTLTFNVTDSSSNTLVGATSGNGSLTGHDNTSIGANTLLHLTSGIQNAGLGSGALKACTSGGNNIAQGQGSLQLLTTGSYNTCIGGATGQNYTSSESSNIQIGYNTLGTVSESNVLRIGAGTGTGNGQLNVAYISGITGIAVTGAAVLVSTGNQLGVAVSSRKYKENIHDMGDVSSQILSLRPVIFNYIGSDLAQHGLIAEEVAEIIPSLVVYDNQGDPQTVKYHELPALLLNELQKAFARIEALEAKLGDR